MRLNGAAAPDKGIPQDLIEKAHCIVIVPDFKAEAFVFGGKNRKGYLFCRNSRGWSAPGTVRIEVGISCVLFLHLVVIVFGVRWALAGSPQFDVSNSASFTALASDPNPQEIIQRSVEANQADWKEADKYSFTERDEETPGDSVEKVKTYRVLMLEGSPYSRLIAVNDEPVPSERQAEEVRKLEREIYNRQHERKEERDQRIAKYSKERDQDHALLKEMAGALDYTVVGTESLDGHDVGVLDATSKSSYKPKNRETKILTGMIGKLWIDKATYQWVRVEAQVVRPISFLGFIAKVGPGTSFVLDQEPMSGNLWLPKHFSMKVNATILGFLHRNSSKDETYSDYRIEDRP